MTSNQVPELMPVLSRGKHRSPRKGACFMELASYLAGEPWSDHPRCTHPLLAVLARAVNDHVSDAGRPRLAPLIPRVIGLAGDGPEVDALIARHVASAALPVVAAERQNVLAVGLMLCEQQLAALGWPPSPETRAALDAVPHSRDWALRFLDRGEGNKHFHDRGAPAIVHKAVSGIAVACVDDPESLLVDLLESTIRRCESWLGHDVQPLTEERWSEACSLTLR
jgi:hypothetical protein